MANNTLNLKKVNNTVSLSFGENTAVAVSAANRAEAAVLDATAQADRAEAEANNSEGAASLLLEDLTRDSSNGQKFSAPGDVTLGEPEFGKLYNSGGSVATLANYWTTGLNGPLPAGNYTIAIAPWVDSRWVLRGVKRLYAGDTPASGISEATAGSGLQVRSHSYTAATDGLYHAFHGQWTDAGNPPTSAQFKELLKGLVIRRSEAPVLQEEPAVKLLMDDFKGDVIVDSHTVGNVDYFYVRTPTGNPSEDLIVRWSVFNPGGPADLNNAFKGNGVIDNHGIKVVSKSWSRHTRLSVVWDSSTSYKITEGRDESPPIMQGAAAAKTFIGMNHGFPCGSGILSGETLSYSTHIGKLYTDGAGKEFQIFYIDPATGFARFAQKPTGSGGLYERQGSNPSGGTLAPVGGGTTLTVTSYAADQLWKYVGNYSASLTIDGRPYGPGMEMRSGSVVKLSESYDIPNFLSLYNTIAGKNGTYSANPVPGSEGADVQFQDSYSRVMDFTGMIGTQRDLLVLQDSVVGVHLVQTARPELSNGATSLFALVPGSSTINGRDFSVGSDITGNSSSNEISDAFWDSPTEPPAVSVTLARLGSTTKYGVAAGVDRGLLGGVPATRDANLGSGYAVWINTTEKTYLATAVGKSVSAGQLLSSRGYHGALMPSNFGGASYNIVAPMGDKEHLQTAYSVTNLGLTWLPIDSRLEGRKVVLQSQRGGAILHSSVVGKKGILVTLPAQGEIETLIS